MLKFVLIANAVSCLIFGAMFFLSSEDVSTFIGSPPVLLLQIVGVGLIFNAGLLIATSLRRNPPRRDIMLFVLGDVSWVLITAVLLLIEMWITSTAGVVWSLAVAAFVGLCGWLQWRWAPSAPNEVNKKWQ